jgi:hypothetical protein
MPQNKTFNNIKHDHALPKASANNKRGFIRVCKGEMDNLNRNGRCLSRLPSPTGNNQNEQRQNINNPIKIKL